MLFEQHADPAEVEAAQLKDKLSGGALLNTLSPYDYCRAMSFVDHWEGDLFLPRWVSGSPWDAGGQMASGRIIGVDTDFDFNACHNALITHTMIHARASKVTVVLPFMYTWTDVENPSGSTLDPETWLRQGAPKLEGKQRNTVPSPIPFSTFAAFYNWFVNPNENPVFKNALEIIESFEVLRLPNTIPIGIRIEFKPNGRNRKMGALMSLSRFLYDSFYVKNTLKRRRGIKKYFNSKGPSFKMKAAVILSELDENGDAVCGHSIATVGMYTLFNWLADKPNATTTSWTGIWASSHAYPFTVYGSSAKDLHATIQTWIKEGLIPDVYVHEDAKVPESVRSGEPRKRLSGNNVRARRVPSADIAAPR